MSKRRRGRGEGALAQLPSGHWRAILSLGQDAAGKRRRLTFTSPAKGGALAWLRDRQAELGRGQFADAGSLTLGAWLTRWLAQKKTQVEYRTWRTLDERARLHITPRVGELQLARLRPADIADLYASMRAGDDAVSAAMSANCGRTLRAALADAVRQRLLQSNPAAAIKLPRADRKRPQVWGADEVRAFLAAARGDRLEALWVVALDTGMRQGELLALCWPEVDLAAGAVQVRHSLEQMTRRRKDVKTKNARRRIGLSPAGRAALAALTPSPAGPVFADSVGGHLDAANVQKAFGRLVKAAGVKPIRFHDLRHTHATLALAAGASLRGMSARLGHASPAFTLATYAHALPEQDEAIAGFWGGLLATNIGPGSAPV